MNILNKIHFSASTLSQKNYFTHIAPLRSFINAASRWKHLHFHNGCDRRADEKRQHFAVLSSWNATATSFSKAKRLAVDAPSTNLTVHAVFHRNHFSYFGHLFIGSDDGYATHSPDVCIIPVEFKAAIAIRIGFGWLHRCHEIAMVAHMVQVSWLHRFWPTFCKAVTVAGSNAMRSVDRVETLCCDLTWYTMTFLLPSSPTKTIHFDKNRFAFKLIKFQFRTRCFRPIKSRFRPLSTAFRSRIKQPIELQQSFHEIFRPVFFLLLSTSLLSFIETLSLSMKLWIVFSTKFHSPNGKFVRSCANH